MSTSKIVREFGVSAERLYAALEDQDSMGKWMGARVSVPVRGQDGVVGTVRHIHAGPVVLKERIVAAQAPDSIDYEVVRPMPLLRHHHGQMRIESLGPERSRLTWTVELELTLGLDALVLPVIRAALSSGLGRLAKQLER